MSDLFMRQRGSTQPSARQRFNPVRPPARGLVIVISCAILLGAAPAFANTPVVLVFLLAPFFGWWATLLGMIFEGFCVWRFLGLNWYKTIAGVITANIASTMLGIIPIAFFGGIIEGILRATMAGSGTTLPILVGFSIAQLLLPAINAAIELPVLMLFGVRRQWRSARILYAANFVSVAIIIWPLLRG